MMECSEIERLIQAQLKGAQVTVVDTTGTMDHFGIDVVSDAFRGVSRLEQHRMVQRAVQEALNDGRIHAITISTSTPSA